MKFFLQNSPAVPRAQGKNEHLYWMDWFRFVAALMVVVCHARGGIWLDWASLSNTSKTPLVAIFFALSRLGAESVLVFFVLSGFLVGGKILSRLQGGTFDFRVYVIDRISRIWTPLIPALLFSAAVAYYVGKPVNWMDFVGNLLGLQGVVVRSFSENHPLWSLAYEIWFYVLAAGIAVWSTEVGNARLLATFVIILAACIFVKLEVVFLFSWFIGALTYGLLGYPAKRALAVLGAAFIGIGVVITQARSASVSFEISTWSYLIPSGPVGMLIFSSGIALVIPFLAGSAPQSKNGFRIAAVGSALANFSYTLYLVHYPILYLWEYLKPGRYEVFDHATLVEYIIRVSSCVVFSWFFYLCFERHTMLVRDWMRRCWSVR